MTFKIKELSLTVFIYILIISAFTVVFFIFPSFTGTNNKTCSDGFNHTASPEIPEELNFAGERVPLENFDTRESLDRELLVNTYFHSQTFLLIKRAARFFPVIEPILAEQGVPNDFKYIAAIESGLDNVVSPKKAVGFWQILEGTARDYGLEVNDEVDERYHLTKSTIAASKYLLESYGVYGNWTMVAASYNAGRRGVERQMERQDETTYYNLLLNEETARYVFRALALKLIMEHPEKYGFNISEKDLYPQIPTFTVATDSTIPGFSAFAREHGTNYKMLKYFNPWLRETYLTNKQRKKYYISIPGPGAREIYNTGYNRDSLLKTNTFPVPDSF